MDVVPELTALAGEARGMVGRVDGSRPGLSGLGDRIAGIIGGTTRRSDIVMAGLVDGTSSRLGEAVAALTEAATRADQAVSSRASG